MEPKLRLIEGGARRELPRDQRTPRGSRVTPGNRIGLMGLGDADRKALLDWATERALLTVSFALDIEAAEETLGSLDLLVIDAEREPLLSIAECGRLMRTLPSLPIALVGPGDPKLESAALRAGARWYFSRERGGAHHWEVLHPALSFRRSPVRPPTLQRLCRTVEIDRAARVLYVGGERRTPSATKFDLLLYLLDRAGRAVSARELVAQGLLLPTQVERFRGIIRELRRYLGPAGDLIRPVTGYGYRLDLEA
jgi:DNA-binding response OmpR family regulator